MFTNNILFTLIIEALYVGVAAPYLDFHVFIELHKTEDLP